MKLIYQSLISKKNKCRLMIAAGLLLMHNPILAQSNEGAEINIGVIYPLSTQGIQSGEHTNKLSIHLLAGLSKAEDGLTLAGLSNVVKTDANGCQLAGFSNHIAQTANGLTMAGFVNTYRRARGTQFAGFANIAKSEIVGTQFAGFLNTSGYIKGTQFAGFVNRADQVDGTQFAGFINKANDVNGTQFGGFINMAKKIKGAQIAGFINIADSSDYPIALINIIKNGEQQIGLSIDESQTTLLSFRSGGKILYGILGAGVNFKQTKIQYAWEAGFGMHTFSGKNFRLNPELSYLQLTDFKKGYYSRSTLRLMPAYRFGKSIEITAGPSFNYVNTNTSFGRSLHSNHVWERSSLKNYHALYFGFNGGIHIIL